MRLLAAPALLAALAVAAAATLAPPAAAPFIAGVTLLVDGAGDAAALQAAAPRCVGLPTGVPVAARTAAAPCGGAR
jgi:hypothetical protein